MDINNDDITRSQLEELDVLLKELQKSSVHNKPDFLGCDLMEEYVSKGGFYYYSPYSKFV